MTTAPASPPAGSPLRVGIVDDHLLFVESFVRVLQNETDLVVAGTAGTLRAAVASLPTWSTDVVVLDRLLPDGDALDHLETIARQAPRARIVMLTSHDGRAVEARALLAGVHAFVSKTARLGLVLEAVRSPATQVGELHSRATVGLTPRENQIMLLVAEGLTNVAIAERLSLSRFTVRNRIAELCAKVGVHSKLELVVEARRLGLIR